MKIGWIRLKNKSNPTLIGYASFNQEVWLQLLPLSDLKTKHGLTNHALALEDGFGDNLFGASVVALWFLFVFPVLESTYLGSRQRSL